jgi:sugar phosphate isomerase/epimerase
MNTRFPRRRFLSAMAGGVAAGAATSALTRAWPPAQAETQGYDFKISLAAWSLHRTIGASQDRIPMLDMPQLAREEFGLSAIELVNHMLASTGTGYLDQLAHNAATHNIQTLLIMVDGEGGIGSSDENERRKAVANHSRWIDIASGFGCHSIRMNWAGAPHDVDSNPEALAAFTECSVPGLRALCDYADKKKMNVLIENHGGPSSSPAAMTRLMQAVNHERFGSLPDFGNFPPGVDVYEGVNVLMNYAKAVSAKCYDFDPETGQETRLDYRRLLDIVVGTHHYHGYIGIEYEGQRLSEFEGVKACKRLLDSLRSNGAQTLNQGNT